MAILINKNTGTKTNLYDADVETFLGSKGGENWERWTPPPVAAGTENIFKRGNEYLYRVGNVWRPIADVASAQASFGDKWAQISNIEDQPWYGITPMTTGGAETWASLKAKEADLTRSQSANNLPVQTIGTSASTFRARNEGESMYDYLTAKQAAGVGGVNLASASIPVNTANQGGLPPGNVVPPMSNVQDIQKLYEILGLQTTGLGKNFVGSVPQIEALKKATGGQFNITPESLMSSQEKPVDLTQSGSTTPSAYQSLPGSSGNVGVLGTFSQEAMTEAERVTADIENRKKIMEATKTPDQKRQEDLILQQMESLAGIEGKAAYKAQLEQEKLDPLEKQINDLSTEMASLKNEKARLLAEERGKPITLNSIIGTQAQINAVMDSKIFGISSMIDALNGNIARAEKSIERAINAKYGVLEERAAIAKSQLEAIKPLLDKQEKLQADALDAENERRKQQLSNLKQSEKDIQNLKLEYVKEMLQAGKTPDQNVISRFESVRSVNEAINVFGENAPKKKITTGKETENEVVNLYSDIMEKAIKAGASTADEVLAGVLAVADSQGTSLTIKQQNAIRNKALELLSGNVPIVVPQSSQENIQQDSFEEQGLGKFGTKGVSYPKEFLNVAEKFINTIAPTRLVDTAYKYLFNK